MSARDELVRELAAVIAAGYGDDTSDCPYDHAPVIADALIAAGYSKATPVYDWGVGSRWATSEWLATRDAAKELRDYYRGHGEPAFLMKRTAGIAPGPWERAE